MEDKNQSKVMKYLIIVMATGVLSGFFGGWFFFYGIKGYLNSSSVVPNAYTNNPIIRDAKKIVIEQSDRLPDLITNAKSNLIGVYKKKAGDQIYNQADLVGQGMVITNDGWLIVRIDNKDDKISEDSIKDNYLVAGSDRKIRELGKVIFDDKTGFWFAKINNVSGWNVANLTSAKNLKIGEMIVSYGLGSKLIVNYLPDTNKVGGVYSSEDASRKLNIVTSDKSLFATVDLNGNVVALINTDGQSISTDLMLSAQNSLLKDSSIKRALLGVNYKSISKEVSAHPRKGVIISNKDKESAIAVGSPADLIGLKEGDLILSIDDVELNESNDLAEIIAGYKPGDKIYIKYKRDAKDVTTELTLGQIKK